MQCLRVKNLEKHQHYKDRRPPWIKLHAEVLDDYKFSRLQDASKAHLMLLWVLASRLDNRIPYDLPWITQQINATQPVDVDELVALEFIEVFDDGSKTLAPRKQSAMPETEGETEKEQLLPRKKPRGGREPSSTVGSWLEPYLAAHRAVFPGSLPPAGRYARVFKRLEKTYGHEEVLRRWANCLGRKREYATPEELSSHWSEYNTAGSSLSHLAGYPNIVINGEVTEYGERLTRPA